MKLARVLLLISMAAGLGAQTATWDTSGNGMLSGTYYFRHVIFVLSSNGDGTLSDAYSLYGTVNFNGTGTYSTPSGSPAILVNGGQYQNFPITGGTYSIAASGQGFLSNPLSSGDFIHGVVNAQGIFVGSSTENANFYNDLFIAAPLPTPLPGLSTFKGSYSMAYMDFSSGTPVSTVGGILSMNPDGAGNLGTVGFTGYMGQSAKGVQSLPNIKYIFSGGAAKVTFPSSSTALFVGDYYLYFSPDGNFVFGGGRFGYDFLVGVRTGNGTPNLSGAYVEAGLDQNESTFAAGYAAMDSFYGSFAVADSTNIVGHQRVLDYFNGSTFKTALDHTYSDTYSVPANGAYSSPDTNYVVGNGIRIGSGIGPYLGLSVALQAPTMSSSLSTTGVFLNPQGVVNAGSFAPFTAGVAPGEMLTLYGNNLASGGLQLATGIPLPTTVGNVQVTVNGVPAPIFYVSPTQLSAIVPYGVIGSVAKIQVINNNVASNAVTEWISDTAPGAFMKQANGHLYAAMRHQDGVTEVTVDNPAQIGETVSVYLTGLGAVNPAIADGAAGPVSPLSYTASTITAYVDGVAVTPAYAGLAPQFPGLYQINLLVPTGATAGQLTIAGPDAFSSECLIPLAGATASSATSAVTEFSVLPKARARRGTTGPRSR
jgi:uncharacterized protein (TIGR03437 family)